MLKLLQSAQKTNRGLAWMAIVAILFVGTLQACHVCALDTVGGTHKVNQAGAISDNGGICPICLTSQTASAPIALLVIAPKYAPVATAILPAIFLHDSAPQIALSIRPPPSR